MTVEPNANLRGNVGQQECFIHGILGRLGVGGRDHVPPVIPTPEVVLQFGTEHRRYAFILHKVAFRPISGVGFSSGGIFPKD
jgi:hypothetical protein